MGAILFSLAIVGMLAWLGRKYWMQLYEVDGPGAQRQFLLWTGKGLAVPMVFWILINSGVAPGMPILLPEVALSKSRGGNWVQLVAQSCAPIGLIAGSYWAAITFAWLQAVVAVRAQDRGEFKAHAIFWSALLLPGGSLVYYLAGPAGLGLALLVWLVPGVHLTMPLARKTRAPPSYSRAVASLKFGKYKTAELQVIQQLER